MFDYLVRRWRVAKVQAELKAQIDNQQLVNSLCQRKESLELIEYLYRNAYYRKRKDAAFLIVCSLAVMVLTGEEYSEDEKELCYLVLNARYERMRTDNQYCLDNFLIIADFKEALERYR